VNFVALDVETANPDCSSICQIATVSFADGRIASAWQTYVDPQDYFDSVNISIHGITEDDVRGAPTLPQLLEELRRILTGRIVACHTAFDRVALARATEKYQLQPLDVTWLDTARVARRVWSQFERRGYGLASVAKFLGIEFKHHEARGDACAAGELLIRAIAKTGVGLEEWLLRVERGIGETAPNRFAQLGKSDGPLAGQIVVFTGGLSVHRHEAARLAAEAGCDVSDSVNRSTTLLVVGDQDLRKLAGHQKSSKHRKAEDLIGKGQPIRILSETDFWHLLRIESPVVC
jgi:DNA polymerase-3 subunit epsilon